MRTFDTQDDAVGLPADLSAAARAGEPVRDRRLDAFAQSGGAIFFAAAADGQVTDVWRHAPDDQDAPASRRSGWSGDLHPDDMDRVAACWRLAVASGSFAPVEARLRQSPGGFRWVRLNAVALRDTAGAITEWLGTAIDIQEQRDATEALRRHEERLRFVVEATALGIWELVFPSGRASWTPEARTMVGIGPDVVIDEALFYALVHPDDRARLKAKDARVMQGLDRDPYTTIYRLRHAVTGEDRWIQEWGRPEHEDDTGDVRIVGALMDITERRRLEIDRDSNEERWRLALQAGRMMAWERNAEADVVTRSHNAEDLVGALGCEGSNAAFLEHVHPDDRDALEAFYKRLSPRGQATVQFRFRHPDGRERWFETSGMLLERPGVPSRMIGVTCDVTARKEAEQSLLRSANHDALTGLLNRNAMTVQLDRAIKKARRTRTKTYLFLLDLDHFKDVNDTLGHDAGDMLLKVTAERLKSVIGRKGCVARLGGDEFAIIVEAAPDPLDAERLGRLILGRLGRPFRYKSKTLRVEGSIGIACYPDQGTSQSDILKAADLALYAGKNGSRGRASLYTPDMRQAMESRITLSSDMRAALDADQIVPFYQPIVDLETRTIVGFEALARWIHPVHGVLAPNVFAGVFDDVQMAIAIDDRMLRHVTRDIAAWLALGLPCGRVALNFTSFAFRSSQFVQRVRETLADAQVPPHHLEIEVTETLLLDRRTEDVSGVLRQLRDLGITIALDDFGTGYASLAHLKRFVVDAIKIDQSFIRDLETDPQDAAIVSAITGLGRSFGLAIVAEGVETAGQEALLRAWGCSFGQGYLYAKPMAGSRVPWMLRQQPVGRETIVPARGAGAATLLR